MRMRSFLLFTVTCLILAGCSSNGPSTPPVQLQTAPPTFTPSTGTYNTKQSVQIADPTPGATIYYTKDGTPPSTSSETYAGAISVGATETLKAVALAPGDKQSGVTTSTVTITQPIAYTIAGTLDSISLGDGGPATRAYLDLPMGIAVDSSGNVYISNAGNYLVRKIAKSTGIITTYAGVQGLSYSGDGGPAVDAGLAYPGGLALDSAGNLYIATLFDNAVRKVTASTGIITTVAGDGSMGYSGDGGAASSAQLNYPAAVVADALGNLFIADTGNNAIREVSMQTGIISTIAGSGKAGYSGDAGPATQATLSSPSGVVLDGEGNLYISDCNNNVIRKIIMSTGDISTVAGNGYNATTAPSGNGSGGYTGDGGPATSAELFHPQGIAFDLAGNLYFADSGNNVVREVSAITGTITTLVGTGGFGYNGSGIAASSTELGGPMGITFDSTGNLYIADFLNNLAREVEFYTALPQTPAPTPVLSPAGGTFTYPASPSVQISDSAPGAEILYTTDGSAPTLDSPILETGISVNATETIKAIAVVPGYAPSAVASATYTIVQPVAPSPTFSPAPGAYATPQLVSICCGDNWQTIIFYTINGSSPAESATSFRYNDPIPVSATETITATIGQIDSLPSPTVSATYTITRPANQLIYTFAGDKIKGYAGDNGPAPSAGLNGPNSIAFDSTGNAYIADTGNNVIRKVAMATGIITTISGDGTSGYSGDGGAAINARLSQPTCIALDGADDIYIADSANNVIRKITASTGVISTIAGNGQAGFAGDGERATAAQLSLPTGVALDHEGNIYIADNANDRVREISAVTGSISTVAGGGSGGDGGPAIDAKLPAATRVTLDRAGNLYIAGLTQIEMVTAKTGIINTVAGWNVIYSMHGGPPIGDGGPATSALIQNPLGMDFDAAGNLYIADSGNARVREVNTTTGIITSVAGSALYSVSGDGWPATDAGLSSANDVKFDHRGNFFVADALTPQIREVRIYTIPPSTATATPVFNPATGGFASAQTVTIADSSMGAAIYYTTDGTVPSTSSAIYSGPMVISANETLKAIALAPGYLVSPVAEGAYTVAASPALTRATPD
jgi:sugar lactone lactonase YvrE